MWEYICGMNSQKWNYGHKEYVLHFVNIANFLYR